jgi:nickel-type superoxide dismutase maturation protease
MEKPARRVARLSPVRVEGGSMSPTLPAGALVAVSPLHSEPALGSIVVVRRPDGTEHLKRIASRSEAGYVVLGDNQSASTDSRHYGPVERSQLVAIARFCYWPPSAWKLLRPRVLG